MISVSAMTVKDKGARFITCLEFGRLFHRPDSESRIWPFPSPGARIRVQNSQILVELCFLKFKIWVLSELSTNTTRQMWAGQILWQKITLWRISFWQTPFLANTIFVKHFLWQMHLSRISKIATKTDFQK